VDSAGRVRVTNGELQRILGAGAGEIVLADGEPYARVGELLGFSKEETATLEEAVLAVLVSEREHLHLEIEVTDREPLRAYLFEGARMPRYDGGSAPKPPHAQRTELLIELCDVSQEWAQRRSLEQELHMLQALIDAIPSPLYYKDSEGIYLGCNRAFERYMGVPRERVVGGTVYDLAPKELADTYHKMDLLLMQERDVQTYETPVQYADGTMHDVVCNRAAVALEDGEIMGMVGVMHDITQVKAAEAELRQQNRRLSTPILELGTDIVALPLIGAVDADRAALIMDQLLAAVARGKYRVVILDVTGVDAIDAETAAHFTQVLRAVSLLGAKCLFSGISPSVAQTMVALGVDLSAVRTLRNMKQALAAALEQRHAL
jgi:PAS domain S-box-containing protein